MTNLNIYTLCSMEYIRSLYHHNVNKMYIKFLLNFCVFQNFTRLAKFVYTNILLIENLKVNCSFYKRNPIEYTYILKLPVLLIALVFEHDVGVIGGVPGIRCMNNN